MAKSYDEMSLDELMEFIDGHVIMALVAAERTHGERQAAEDYLRDRLVALSDSWPDSAALAAEDSRRRMERLRRSVADAT